MVNGLKKTKQVILNTLACNELRINANAVEDVCGNVENKDVDVRATATTTEIDRYLKGLAKRKVKEVNILSILCGFFLHPWFHIMYERINMNNMQCLQNINVKY